ncbi:uncharacterized protein LOC134257998, partial [Saccostrea cucullata]|uniref:uncharacterized protein LOC134257998 n=1 Tax=Saccostrea cuccullata TaxID=36930 RepID=UPI002ED0CE77
ERRLKDLENERESEENPEPDNEDDWLKYADTIVNRCARFNSARERRLKDFENERRQSVENQELDAEALHFPTTTKTLDKVLERSTRTLVKEEDPERESSDKPSESNKNFDKPGIQLKSSLYQQKEIWKQTEKEDTEKQINIEERWRTKKMEWTSPQRKLLSFDQKLEQLRQNDGEADIRIQKLIDYLYIEQTHSQQYHQYHRGQNKTTKYKDIIQRVDYLDCSGLDLSKDEKQFKGFEPFTQNHVDDFLSWMMDCDEVFQKTYSTKCRSILSTLFAAYTKEAIIQFKPKPLSLIIDICMDHAIENKNHILVLELVRSYIFNFDFNLQKRFEGKKINSVLIDTLLQTAKCMILSRFPRLRKNSISLSFCYECSQENWLVIMMTYKGIIEMKDGIPEKAMGVSLVLYNYTQPSDEAKFVFSSSVASCSVINLPVIAEKEAQQLLNKHSNLSLISASPFKSTGYSTGKHRVVKKPCISLLCLHKGHIPLGEREFPKQINGFDVDVQEGYCSFGSGRSIDFGGHIRRARGINTPGNGSIGGFVDFSDGSVGLITCAHVVFSTDELKIPNSVMQNYLLGIDTDLNVEFFDKNQHNFQVCGTIVDKCFPLSSDIKSVDAALIKLDQTINEFGFPVTLPHQLYSAGFDPNISPVFTGEVVNIPDTIVSSRIPEKMDSVIKYGSKTGFTIGSLYYNGAHIRFVDDTGELPDKTPVHMCNQIEIQSLPHGMFFEPGDSGSFVFCINPDKTLSCIGMAIGSTTKGSCFVTPMTRILDSFGLPHRLKPCTSLASMNNPKTSEKPPNSDLLLQRNAGGMSEVNLGTILLELKMSMTNMQTSLTDLRNEQKNLRSSFQTEVEHLKREVQEIKEEYQTKSSASSSYLTQK